jgi:hypothetical protein
MDRLWTIYPSMEGCETAANENLTILLAENTPENHVAYSKLHQDWDPSSTPKKIRDINWSKELFDGTVKMSPKWTHQVPEYEEALVSPDPWIGMEFANPTASTKSKLTTTTMMAILM